MGNKKSLREDSEVYELRRKRVAELIRDRCDGKNIELSKKLDEVHRSIDPTTISRWFNPPEAPLKNIGPVPAAAIEVAFPDLPQGYILSPLLVPGMSGTKPHADGASDSHREHKARDDLERKLLVAFRKFSTRQQMRIVLEMADTALKSAPDGKRGRRRMAAMQQEAVSPSGKRRNSR